MNDATRKRLEAAGWRTSGGNWWWGNKDSTSFLELIPCETYDGCDIDATHLAALRAFIEAFEQEGKE